VHKLGGESEFWSTSSEMELAVVDPSGDTVKSGGPHGAAVRPTPGFVPFAREEIEQSITRRFERQVEAHPGRIAVKSRRFTVDYTALNQWSNRVAHALLAACGPARVPVALLLERDAPHVAAIVGALKAGKIYVSLVPGYPPARNQLILDDSQARWIITDQANSARAEQLAGDSVSVINIDRLDPGLGDDNPQLDIPADAYAYIIYTSGSTGRPKGIVETHRNVLHNIRNFTNDHYVTCEDRIAGLSSFAFSGSLKELYGSLLNGGTLCPLEIEQVGLHGLAQWLKEEEISIFSSVSTTFRHFAGTLTGRESFPKLRLIRIGGEEVTWKDIELFKAYFPRGCVLVNGYGSTETGTIRVYMVDHDTPARGSAVPIGYPVEGLEVRVLDDNGEMVGPGEVGQIAVRGAFLAAGYWRRPELTRQAFQPDPEREECRLYLTGDLGVMEPDGCLVHAGRKDFQVKVRGNRVEVSEIETALLAAPGVAEAAVTARDDLPDERRLVAYLVATPASPPPTARRLREFLKQRLPDFSIPSQFVWLDEMPLTPSGKIDRKGLPAAKRAARERSRAIAAPRTELEERLITIWEELTEFRPIGIDDDFFELGGDSLLGARLFAEIHKNLGKNLPLETLSTASTIERLARLLSDTLGPPEDRAGIIALKATGSQLPFFAIPGTATHPLAFYHLAHLSDPEQPFFGLVYPEATPEQPYPTRIEDLAQRLIPEIRKIQPEGPYRLGGHSFGGVVAFEMAQQLIALGHEVSLLVLLDTWGKTFPFIRPLPWRILDHVEHLTTLRFPDKLAYLAEKTATLGRMVATALRRPGAKSAPPEPVDATAETLAINHLAWLGYQPKPYPGRLVVFRAEQTPNWVGVRFEDPFLGWGSLALQGIEVHTVPADHWTLLHRENVPALADGLNRYLRM
jgi:amino acid adenylation domain-containing protein